MLGGCIGDGVADVLLEAGSDIWHFVFTLIPAGKATSECPPRFQAAFREAIAVLSSRSCLPVQAEGRVSPKEGLLPPATASVVHQLLSLQNAPKFLVLPQGHHMRAQLLDARVVSDSDEDVVTATFDSLRDLGVKTWNPSDSKKAILGLTRDCMEAIWSRHEAFAIDTWFKLLVKCLREESLWPPDQDLAKALGDLGGWALAHREDALCSIVMAVMDGLGIAHDVSAQGSCSQLASACSPFVHVVIKHLESSYDTAAGSWCWWTSPEPASALEPVFAMFIKLYSRGLLQDDQCCRFMEYYKTGLEKIHAQHLWSQANWQDEKGHWWVALAKLLWTREPKLNDHIKDALFGLTLKIPAEGWWDNDQVSIADSIQRCDLLLALLVDSKREWDKTAADFVSHQLADHLFAALRRKPSSFWSCPATEALDSFRKLLGLTRLIAASTKLDAPGPNELLVQLLRSAPYEQWWADHGAKPFVQLVSMLDHCELKCFAKWDGARALIPLQGPDRSLLAGRNLKQDQIFLPPPRASREDLEVLLAPSPILQLLHADCVSELVKADDEELLEAGGHAGGKLINRLAEAASIDWLDMQDLQKHLVAITREQKSRAEAQLAEGEQFAAQLAAQLAEAQAVSIQLRPQLDAAQEENARLQSERDDLQAQRDDLQAALRRAEQMVAALQAPAQPLARRLNAGPPQPRAPGAGHLFRPPRSCNFSSASRSESRCQGRGAGAVSLVGPLRFSQACSFSVELHATPGACQRSMLE